MEQSRILEKCFKHSLSLLAILDRDFNFIRVNELYAKADNRNISDFHGHNHFEFYPSEAKKIFEQVVLSKLPYQVFARPFIYSENPDRGVTYWDWKLVPILDDFGEVEFLIFSLNNVTDHIKAERKLKKIEKEMAHLDRLNLIAQMAASIAHEIRNPMTTVRGFLQMLGGKKEYANNKEYFNLMIEELDRANSIITEFLSLAKNKALEELKINNLKLVVETLFPLLQADAMMTDKNIHMELEDVPDLLLDEKEIRQMVLNLVRNGLETMSPGGNLTIRLYREGNEIVLAVQDQGKGISPDILDKIGTPFITTKDNGTGLGLATCYSIAARHNAKVNIQSNSTGTTFFVRFKVNLDLGRLVLG